MMCQDNDFCENASVFYGSDFLSEFNVNELAMELGYDEPVYNRSVKGLTVEEASKTGYKNIVPLNPAKIFLNFGDTELAPNGTSVYDFADKYEWLLYALHQNTNARLYVLSVADDVKKAVDFNTALKKLCSETHCDFIDISSAVKSSLPYKTLFNILRPKMRSKSVMFAEAMSLR